MENLDWSTFTRRINITAPNKAIFNSWNIQENLELWFLKDAQFYIEKGKKRDRNSKIEKGDIYTWTWHGSDFVAEGEVKDIDNEKQQLKFTFLGCIVDVEVKNEEGEHILQITQSEIPLDEESRMNLYVGCTMGWTFYAANLKSILEGGIDLRNKKDELKNVINT